MDSFLKKLDIENINYGSCIGGEKWFKTEGSGEIISCNPSTGSKIASVLKCSEHDYENVIKASSDAFEEWRKVPAPIRGQLIFDMGNII